jgi:hypothetical protein
VASQPTDQGVNLRRAISWTIKNNIMKCSLSIFSIYLLSGLILLTGCSPSSRLNPGPDRETAGAMQGALTGAGAGAVTGFQIASPTGPAAFVGAGFGAVAGAITGALQDENELQIIQAKRHATHLRYRASVQALLEKYFKKRIELHPTRDIYPADLFFNDDSSKLSKQGWELAAELARLNKERLPWSRMVIASYVKSVDENSMYAKHLASKRAVAIGDAFVHYGMEPRRIETRPVIMTSPLVLDPDSPPLRYAQAIELIAVDR